MRYQLYDMTCSRNKDSSGISQTTPNWSGPHFGRRPRVVGSRKPPPIPASVATRLFVVPSEVFQQCLVAMLYDCTAGVRFPNTRQSSVSHPPAREIFGVDVHKSPASSNVTSASDLSWRDHSHDTFPPPRTPIVSARRSLSTSHLSVIWLRRGIPGKQQEREPGRLPSDTRRTPW